MPCDDREAGHLDHFQMATDPAGGLVACVGLEIHGDAALLRSLAVATAHRRHGLGSATVVAAETVTVAVAAEIAADAARP